VSGLLDVGRAVDARERSPETLSDEDVAYGHQHGVIAAWNGKGIHWTMVQFDTIGQYSWNP